MDYKVGDGGRDGPTSGSAAARGWSAHYGAAWVASGDSNGGGPAPQIGGGKKMVGSLRRHPLPLDLSRPVPAGVAGALDDGAA
jgi:hypothetical protein